MKALFLTLLPWWLGAAEAAEPAPRHVVMVSIDGLMPETYLRPDELGLAVPTLRRLVAQGAFAEGVTGVLPTVTYPSHTTLITGVPPRLHGITANRIFDPEERSAEAWTWYARDVQVPTLVSAAEARWLTTAAVAWPVTVGLVADFNLPEIWRSGSTHPDDLKLLDLLSTPGLLRAVETFRGRPFSYPPTDEERLDAGRYLIETQRPHLLLLHLIEVDSAQHDFGPGSPEAKAAIEGADARLGRLLESVGRAGLAASTAVVVVSDHGFLPAGRAVRPNTLLRDLGLIELDEQGKVQKWRAFFHPSGGSASLYLDETSGPIDLAALRSAFEARAADPASGLLRVLGPEEVRAMGGDALLALDARPGFSFTGSAAGEWLGESKFRGTHGHAPDRPELRASLIWAGPGLDRRGSLGLVPMTAIAPTVARWLGLTLAPEAAQALPLTPALSPVPGERGLDGTPSAAPAPSPP